MTILPLPLLSSLPDAVAAVRLDELPLAREEIPVVIEDVVGLGGIVNGCGAPGIELLDALVAFIADVAP